VSAGSGAPTVQRWPTPSALTAVEGAHSRATAFAGDTLGDARDLALTSGSGLQDAATGAVTGASGAAQHEALALATRAGSGVGDALSVGEEVAERAHSAIGSAPTQGALPGIPEVDTGNVPLSGVPALPASFPMTDTALPAPTAPASAPSGQAATSAASPAGSDLDELAHKLYDHIRWRLRAELRLDMERAGLGAGVRR
jgi:hypothetical protein